MMDGLSLGVSTIGYLLHTRSSIHLRTFLDNKLQASLRSGIASVTYTIEDTPNNYSRIIIFPESNWKRHRFIILQQQRISSMFWSLAMRLTKKSRSSSDSTRFQERKKAMWPPAGTRPPEVKHKRNVYCACRPLLCTPLPSLFRLSLSLWVIDAAGCVLKKVQIRWIKVNTSDGVWLAVTLWRP